MASIAVPELILIWNVISPGFEFWDWYSKYCFFLPGRSLGSVQVSVTHFYLYTCTVSSRFWMVENRAVAKVGELISIEVCMDIMDLLYEKEEMSVHFRSPKSLAASILVYSLLLISKFQVIYYCKVLTYICRLRHM